MTTLGLAMLKHQLRRDEGSSLESYHDPAGNLSIGCGHNIDAHGITITPDLEEKILEEDIARAMTELDAACPWVQDLDEVRQRVLYNMAFNLGTAGLLKFQRTMDAVKAGQYTEAAAFMLRSIWAGQVGQRADRLSEMMRTGVDAA